MPTPLPYLPTYKNIEKLFTGIHSAKIPDTFLHKFLTETIGLKGVGDRPLIPLLRSMGFLDSSNKPTSSYAKLKNPQLRGKAIADAVKLAYKPLFDANEEANKLSTEELKGLIAQVSGYDAATLSKTLGTLNGLLKLSDFSSEANAEGLPSVDHEDIKNNGNGKITNNIGSGKVDVVGQQIDSKPPAFHFNIQVHLPSNASEEVYLNIFNAIRKVFN
jgi:Family of unknown function (DUF5343)